MRPIELTPRLMAVALQVPVGARFADVGTDHARLPVWLLEQGIIHTAIATDLRKGPLERARNTAGRHDLTEQVSLRLGGGLQPLQPNEIDVVAIAGMGGETIISILAESPWIQTEPVTILLQPMTSTHDLRSWLVRHGWRIEREELIKEGQTIYVILTVRFAHMIPLSRAESWVGRQEKGMLSPLRCEYLTLMTERAERALEGIYRSTRPEDVAGRVELELLCTELKNMKEEWELWQL